MNALYIGLGLFCFVWAFLTALRINAGRGRWYDVSRWARWRAYLEILVHILAGSLAWGMVS